MKQTRKRKKIYDEKKRKIKHLQARNGDTRSRKAGRTHTLFSAQIYVEIQWKYGTILLTGIYDIKKNYKMDGQRCEKEQINVTGKIANGKKHFYCLT